jgi:lipopolysaccharide transport system ATP-binding protein
MSHKAVSVRDLGKSYTIGALRRHRTLRDALAELPSKLRPRGRSATAPVGTDSESVLWALRHVSFEVGKGEIVGIIGRNGAGKSTLLKILSRVTDPTEGSAVISGRVASLLEVGTGFHGDLTARENVFINGAVLGMGKAEVERKLPAIVAFAEVERFLETPVKHYSSGMYMRLAFSVAAHLDPEVLIVDEVLAVGDAAFQRRCMNRMNEVAGEGRTVLFVSHNMTAVNRLCQRALLLEGGAIVDDGPPARVIQEYLAAGDGDRGQAVWATPEAGPGNDRVRLRAVRVLCDGRTTSQVKIDREIVVEIEFWNLAADARRLCPFLYVLDGNGATVLSTAPFPSANALADTWFEQAHPRGVFRCACTLPANFLNEGRYYLSVYMTRFDPVTIEAAAPEAVAIDVLDTGVMRADAGDGPWHGVVRVRLPWTTELLEGDAP